MDRFEKWGVGIGAFLFVVLALSLLTLWLLEPVRVESLEAHVHVDDYVGFNLDTDKLYFGTVSPGGTGQRSMSLQSNEDFFVKVSVDGPLDGWLSPDEWSFMLTPPGREVQFTIIVPENTSVGNYTSTIDFIFYKPVVGRFLA